MGGFYKGSAGRDDDTEVENLLNQVQEENLLKFSVNSHRSTTGFQAPSVSCGENGDVDDSGLETNLLVRFANLKSRPATEKKNEAKGGRRLGVTAKTPGKVVSEEPSGSVDQPEDEDALVAQLEQRLSALKAGLQASPTGLEAHSATPSKVSVLSSVSSSSPSVPKSRSFSPLRLVKQLSMGRRSSKSSSLKSRSDESISSAEDDDANKLLASISDEVTLEKKDRNHMAQERKFKAEDYLDDVEDDESLLGGDHLTKDLNLKKLKKELSVASVEEDKLAREAQKVIEWAKDVARLEPSVSVSDESDLDELLKLEQGEEDEAIAEDEGEEKLESQKKQKKKPKGKKWSLF